MARMNRPAPVEITYKNMRFLITHNPSNSTLNKFVEVRLLFLEQQQRKSAVLQSVWQPVVTPCRSWRSTAWPPWSGSVRPPTTPPWCWRKASKFWWVWLANLLQGPLSTCRCLGRVVVFYFTFPFSLLAFRNATRWLYTCAQRFSTL